MTEVQIHNTRLDSRANQALAAVADASAAAFGYTAELTLDGQLAQLLRLRVAQINNCTYCLTVHHRAARDIGVPQAKVELLAAWWETQLFSDPERAALEYAEALTLAPPTPRSRRRSSSTTTDWPLTSTRPRWWRSWRSWST